MMQCPYCLSPVQAEASVCKVCSRDIHVFRSLLERIETLETLHVKGQHDAALTEQSLRRRVVELERQLQQGHVYRMAVWTAPGLVEVFRLLLLSLSWPWALLLLGHAVITVVYDLPLLYLHAWVFGLSLVSGGVLQLRHGRRMGPQVVSAVVMMAFLAVAGMSMTTAYVDHVPVWPSNEAQWREFFAYTASIVAGCLLGMLVARKLSPTAVRKLVDKHG